MSHIRCVLRVLKVFSWNSSPPFLKGFVLVIALAFCVVLLCIFILVSCCGLCYDFCIHTMFNSCLPLVVGRRARAYCGVCGCLRILMSNMLSYNMFFKFWAPCCDVRYNFSAYKRFGLVRLFRQLVAHLLSMFVWFVSNTYWLY